MAKSTFVVDVSGREHLEQWQPIPGFEGYYEASNLGRIRGIDRVLVTSTGQRQRIRGKLLAQRIIANGYLVVMLSKHGDYRPRLVHRLVLKAFRGDASDDFECCHINGVATDNRIENLRWDTHEGNSRDQVFVHRTHRNARKAHCQHGHAFTPENTYLNDGRRRCLTCKRARENAQYRKYGKRRAPVKIH